MSIFAILGSPVARYVGILAIAALALWGIDRAGYSRGVADAEGRHALAALHAAEEAHQQHLADVERGDEISKKLLETQRKLRATEHEYLTYANAITGVCDPSFRVFVEHASGAKTGVPEATGPLVATPPAKDAVDPAREQAISRAIGANIAINFARLDACIAQQNAIIDWHEKDLK